MYDSSGGWLGLEGGLNENRRGNGTLSNMCRGHGVA
jgi:hypothetical protein